MATNYYLRFFGLNYRLDSIDKEKFYINLKNDFRKNYKWQPSLFLKLVRENDLDPENSIRVLKWLNENYVSTHGGAVKGYADFLFKLQSKLDKLKKVLTIKDRDAFLEDLELIREKHLNVSNKEYLDFINNNFEFVNNPLTRESLESYFYQKLH